MTKELIICALQIKGRATGRDIAKRAGVENSVAIKALINLEREGRAVQLNGYWWLSGGSIVSLNKRNKRSQND